MGKINEAAIKKFLGKEIKGGRLREEFNEAVDNYMTKGASSGGTSDRKSGQAVGTISEAASVFADVLLHNITSLLASNGFENGFLGESAIEALSDIAYTEPQKISDGKYSIVIYFKGDMSRKSLDPDSYNEIRDIASLLNDGYSARGSVYGLWHNNMIRSLEKRTGAHFIEQSIHDFMGSYASDYGVTDIKIVKDE